MSNKALYKNLPEKIIQLLNFFDASSDIIVICDIELKINYINPAYIKLTGYKANEVIGKSYKELNADEVAQILSKKNWNNIIKGKTINISCCSTKKNGETYCLDKSIISVHAINNSTTFSHLIFSGKDTTEQVTILNKLINSEKNLEEAQKIAQLGYYVLDIKNDSWTSSTELNNIFGINKGYKKTINSWLKLIHPEFKDLMSNYFTNEVLTLKRKFDIEYKIIDFKTGVEKWVHGLGNLKFDKKQQPVEMFGTIQDITYKKEIENALTASEAKFRSIFHSLTACMIIVIDEKGNVLEWNKGAEINFGYSASEMLGKSLRSFMPQRFRKGHEKGLSLALKNKGLTHKGKTFELFGLRKNGDEFPIELTLGSWERDGKLFFSAIIIDVSVRRETEKHLQQANSILEDVDSIVLLTNIKGEVIYTTSCTTRLIGFEPNEILGNKWWEATFVDKIESRRVKNELINYLENGKVVRTTNHPRLLKCKDGTLKWFEWHNSRGVDNCIISVGFDISEKKLVEQQLQNTLNNLSNLVNARTKELENTLNKLEISLNKEKELGELKSRFVSTASHQFRTPLTVIQANVGLINMQIDSLSSEFKEKLRKVTSRIQSEVDRMTELMNDVLVLGRVNAGSIKPDFKPTNLVAIANEIASKYNDIQTDGRTINIVIQGKSYNIMLDGNLFEHTISNLISNAFKYSVGCPDPILTFSFEQKQVFISVKDFGIGIPPNDLKHLFQTFYRASNANDLPGTGLGVAIAKEYTELNGGTISVASKLYEGSEFTVVFKNK